jgi:hypothetical protein
MRFLLFILITYGLIRAAERADVALEQFIAVSKRCAQEPYFCILGGKAPIDLHPFPTDREKEIVTWLKSSTLNEVELRKLSLEPEESMALTTDIFPILLKSQSNHIITPASDPIEANCEVLYKGQYVTIQHCVNH